MKLIVFLQELEEKALSELASRELRDPRSQALLIIRTELERLGLLHDMEYQNKVLENDECKYYK